MTNKSSSSSRSAYACWKEQLHKAWNIKKVWQMSQQHFQMISFSLCKMYYILKHKQTHNASLWVPLASIAECGCKGGGAALVIQGGASVVDGWVDGDRPHAWGITIAVAVVIATTISWCPHIDATFSSTTLKQNHHHHSRVKNKSQFCLLQVGFRVHWWNEDWESGNFTGVVIQ